MKKLTIFTMVWLLVLSSGLNLFAATPRKIRVGYYGGTCEAPIFIAAEKGFFKRNGLDVKLVKLNGEILKEGIATGKLDAVQLSPGTFKPIEQGLNIKITGGVHTGCIQAVVPANSGIKSLKDLKGKTIGVDAIGGVPMVLLSVELNKLGINPRTEVNWVAYPSPQLQTALEKGAIQAFATWDPFSELAVKSIKARIIFSSTHDPKYKDQFCCFIGINGNLVKTQPQVAKAITKALNEASLWVGKNPKQAAQIAIAKKYIGGNIETNAKLLADYHFNSDINQAKASLLHHFRRFKGTRHFRSEYRPEWIIAGSLCGVEITNFDTARK